MICDSLRSWVDPQKTSAILISVGSESCLSRRCKRSRSYEKRLSSIGFAYAVNGKPVTLRTFAHARLFRSQFPAFLKAMSMEADLVQRARRVKGKPLDFPAAKVGDIVALVRRISEAEEEITPTAGANPNGYRKNAHGGNANCYMDLSIAGSPGQTKLVPISQDWTSR